MHHVFFHLRFDAVHGAPDLLGPLGRIDLRPRGSPAFSVGLPTLIAEGVRTASCQIFDDSITPCLYSLSLFLRVLTLMPSTFAAWVLFPSFSSRA